MKMRMVFAVAIVTAALTPAAVKADPQSDQVACMSDAFAVCGQFIPDRERVGMCLYSNRSRVSAPCRAALTRFHPRTASAD
jgi:hypothetical protein